MEIAKLSESLLVQGATEAKRLTRWWVGLLLSSFGALLIGGGIGGALILRLYTPVPGTIGQQVFEAAGFLGALIAIALWVRFKEGRPVSSLGFRGDGALRRFLAGLGIGIGMFMLAILLLFVTGQYRTLPTPAGGVSGMAALVPSLLLLLIWMVQSSTEETLSRGYMLQLCGVQLPGLAALLLPGLAFVWLHARQVGWSEPVALCNIFLFALFTSLIALRQGSIWMCCGLHAGWNWAQGNLFGAPVSNLPPLNTALFPVGPAEQAVHVLSGGTVGPEGSLIVTLVWGIATFMAYRYFRSAGVPRRVAQPA